jgi:hypothetical protein
MTDPEPFWDAERPASSRPITESDIRGWERQHGVTLPRTLAAMLVVQNGGGVSQAEFFIEPLAGISPLSDEQLDEVSEGDDLDLTDGSKLFVFGGDEVGAVLALDYSVGPEPRVLSLWFDGAGESRVEADSFDEFVGGGSEDPADV